MTTTLQNITNIYTSCDPLLPCNINFTAEDMKSIVSSALLLHQMEPTSDLNVFLVELCTFIICRTNESLRRCIFAMDLMSFETELLVPQLAVGNRVVCVIYRYDRAQQVDRFRLFHFLPSQHVHVMFLS